MSDKKVPVKGPAPRHTIEVEAAWLEEAKQPASARPKTRRPPPGAPRRDTIEVDRRWLIPPLPAVAIDDPRQQPPPIPAALATKPRGKLPPPLPRDDANEDPAPRRTPRESKRPPPAKR